MIARETAPAVRLAFSCYSGRRPLVAELAYDRSRRPPVGLELRRGSRRSTGHPSRVAAPADDRQHGVGESDLAAAGGHRVESASGRRIALDRLAAELADRLGGRLPVGLELAGGRGDEDPHRHR